MSPSQTRGRLRRSQAGWALVAALAILVTIGGDARASRGQAPPIALGAFISDSYRRPALYDEYARQVGRKPVLLTSYRSWRFRLIDIPQLDAVWSRGAVPLLTWEPDLFRRRKIPLRAIAKGRFDAYVRRSAAAAAAWGHPILLRFAQEMNGRWFPWSQGKNGNTPEAYVAAWRRLVRIFRASGASNVKWVWAPNINTGGRFPFGRFYPGDRWVDWLGLDGFNWSLSPGWQSFTEIFASSYDKLVRLAPRPVMIAETGTWEEGGDKAEWISSALTKELPRFTRVRALVWSNVDDPRGDFRVDSSAASLRAFRSAIAAPRYATTRAELLATPRRLEGRATVPVPSTNGPEHSVFDRVDRELNGSYVWLAAGLASLLGLLFILLRAQKARRTRDAR